VSVLCGINRKFMFVNTISTNQMHILAENMHNSGLVMSYVILGVFACKCDVKSDCFLNLLF